MYVIAYKETPSSDSVYLVQGQGYGNRGFFKSGLDEAWIFQTGTEAARTMMRRAVATPNVNIEKYEIRKVKPVERPQYELAEVA